MTILHVRLRGPTTTITLPPTMNNARFKLKAFRILFNRSDHGYYLATVTSSLFDEGNVLSYVKSGEPGTRYSEIPLFLAYSQNQTQDFNMDWDLGRVRGTSSVSFGIKFHNSIERARMSEAYFEPNDPAITMLYGVSKYQPYFGQKIPMYISPVSNQPGQTTMTNFNIASGPPPLVLNAAAFGSNAHYAPDGTNITDSPTPTNFPYPSSTTWVHTGVQIANIDPQPGGLHYDTSVTSVEEANIVAKSGGALTGSGFRRNAIPYAYSVDLLFEVTI